MVVMFIIMAIYSYIAACLGNCVTGHITINEIKLTHCSYTFVLSSYIRAGSINLIIYYNYSCTYEVIVQCISIAKCNWTTHK